MSETPFPLGDLPTEILIEVGYCLKASELRGAASASKDMRKILAPSMFHSVRFRGSQLGLARKLQQFVTNTNLESTKILLPYIKYVTIVSRRSTSAVAHLPTKVGRALRKTRYIKGIQLDLDGFSMRQKEAVREAIAALPRWDHLMFLEFDFRTEVERFSAFQEKAALLSALKLDERMGPRIFEAARKSFPYLQRLIIPFELPAIEAASSEERNALDNWNRTERIISWFPRLQWLCLGWTWVTEDKVGSIRDKPETLVTQLVEDLAEMPNLRRFGARFPVQVLETYSPTDPNAGYDRDEIEAWVRPIVSCMGKKLQNLEQIAFFDGDDRVYRGLRMPDQSMRLLFEDDSDRHAFPRGVLY